MPVTRARFSLLTEWEFSEARRPVFSAAAATHSQAPRASLDFAARSDAGGPAGCDVALAISAAPARRTIAAPTNSSANRIGWWMVMDGEAVSAGESQGSARRARVASGELRGEESCGSASRVSPRPISVTPAQGGSGRQSRVDGSWVPRPSHTNAAAGIERGAGEKRARRGESNAARRRARARAGAFRKGRCEQTRRGDASQNAEPDRCSSGAATSVATLTSAAAHATIASRRKKARQRGPSRWADARETPTSPRNAHATMRASRRGRSRGVRQVYAPGGRNRRGPSSGDRRPCRPAPTRARRRWRLCDRAARRVRSSRGIERETRTFRGFEHFQTVARRKISPSTFEGAAPDGRPRDGVPHRLSPQLPLGSPRTNFSS